MTLSLRCSQFIQVILKHLTVYFAQSVVLQKAFKQLNLFSACSVNGTALIQCKDFLVCCSPVGNDTTVIKNVSFYDGFTKRLIPLIPTTPKNQSVGHTGEGFIFGSTIFLKNHLTPSVISPLKIVSLHNFNLVFVFVQCGQSILYWLSLKLVIPSRIFSVIAIIQIFKIFKIFKRFFSKLKIKKVALVHYSRKAGGITIFFNSLKVCGRRPCSLPCISKMRNK